MVRSALGFGLPRPQRRSRGRLKDDLLVVNARCCAGSGVNLDRVLQKLGMGREDVDRVLAPYLGAAGLERRRKVLVRAAHGAHEDLCILVDIGGEDTKISTIALAEHVLGLPRSS